MEDLSRREFIKKSLRFLMAGALSGSALYLFKRSDFIQDEHKCIKANPLCNDCQKNRYCILPQALSFRKVLINTDVIK